MLDSGTTGKASHEQRKHELRVPASMVASIVAPGQLSPAPCRIEEVSPEGARLSLDENWIIPKLFWLRIKGDVRLHYCKVIWRTGTAVGVEFPSERNQWWSRLCDRNRLSRKGPACAFTGR